MPNRDASLRRQISKQVSQPAETIEQRIAEDLIESGTFHERLTVGELTVIMRKLLYMLVARQKVAGIDVPLVHNVSRMDVNIHDLEAGVQCEVHLHSPVTGFIQFRYTLENDPRSPGERLRLKKDEIEVKEVTKPFDVAAKLALKIMDVRAIALREMSDLNGLIRCTLPEQLEVYGFKGNVKHVLLELMDDDTLRVYLAVERSE